ncbi:2-phospho-L-lactate guanylyltransferase [Gordonia neofelifaecis]|nr:2-phospho-L-lactate guanylyltransferase [Gordonia neofelifaecis]
MSVPPSVAVVLAVKRLDDAKSRLASAVPSADRRRSLVTAMLTDTLGAVRDAGVDRVVVVSPDPNVHAVVADHGALALDEPAPDDPGLDRTPLNAALAHGIAAVAPDAEFVAALQADLAALDAETLADALTAAAEAIDRGAPAAFVADRAGEGTSMLVVRATKPPAPRFGPMSAAAHRAAGAVELDPGGLRWNRLRTDVDTPADLTAAIGLGVGPATRSALAAPRHADAGNLSADRTAHCR